MNYLYKTQVGPQICFVLFHFYSLHNFLNRLDRLGQPGVDVHVRHDMDGPPGAAAVLHLQFLVNEGALISATADDTLHLWNFRQKVPQVVQSLKFQKEKYEFN